MNGHYDELGLGYDGAAVGVFPVKPLTPDEYAFAKDLGNDGGVTLAERFLARGDDHLVWSGRPSVLEEPLLRS